MSVPPSPLRTVVARLAAFLAPGFLTALAAASLAVGAEPVTIGGTGAALGAVRLLVQKGEASLAQYPIRVLRSIGSGGAVKALAAGRVDIGVSQRPPKPEERAEINCTPFMISVAAFVTSEASLSGVTLSRQDLARVMAGTESFHGRAIQPILRPAADADNTLLLALAPELAPVLDQARNRSGALVAASHQEALEWAEKAAGSLTLASIDSVRTERRHVYFLHYQGEDPLAIQPVRGHPLVRTYYLFHRPDPGPAVKAWIEFLRGPDAASILNGLGAAPYLGRAGNDC